MKRFIILLSILLLSVGCSPDKKESVPTTEPTTYIITFVNGDKIRCDYIIVPDTKDTVTCQNGMRFRTYSPDIIHSIELE